MLFNKKIVLELLNEIEKNTGLDWIQSIFNICKLNDSNISFSEFETYGNYLVKKNINFNERRFNMIDIPLRPNNFLIWLYSGKFQMISFHKYSWKNDGIFKQALKYFKYSLMYFIYKNN